MPSGQDQSSKALPFERLIVTPVLGWPHNLSRRRTKTNRFRKLTHTIWHRRYYIIWVPKYRHRILAGAVANEIGNCIRAFSQPFGYRLS